MATSLIDSQITPQPGFDPGRSIRRWVAGFLRIGIGLTLLGNGLTIYFSSRGPMQNGNPFGQNGFGVGLDPFISAMPYFEIGFGLALILGFMTTAAAIGSAFYSLITPLILLVTTLATGSTPGPNRGMGNFFGIMMSANLINMLPYAAMIWLSPLDNHPISIDALIFGRNEFVPTLTPPPHPEIQPETEVEPEIKLDEV